MKVAPRQQVERLVRMAVPQSGRYEILRLDKNERCTGYPAPVIQAMLRGLSGHHLAAYPEPGLLYEKIAKSHGVGVDQLALTAGSELAIRYLFEAFLEPADEVVLLNPSFAMFEVYALLCGARLAAVDFNRQWRVDPDDIIGRITDRTKIVALANPNNPTGTVLEEDALLAILRRAARHGALVLVDEAYYHFYRRTMLGHLRRFDNLVVTRTFSKAYGAAGVRLGYAVGARDVLACINKIQPIDHLNVFAIKVGEFLLDHPEVIRDYVEKTRAGQHYLMKTLQTLGLHVVGSHANFVLVDLGRQKEAVIRFLRARHIHVGGTLRLPFSSTFVRVTTGPVSVMKRCADAFKEFFGSGLGRAGPSEA
jgi:histidinol-phosphate aminotransferase